MATPSLVVLTVRGLVNARHEVERTLRQLNIEGKFRATIVPDDSVYRGMLNKVRYYVAWCKAEPNLIETLLSKRARKQGRKPLTDQDVKHMSYESMDALAQALAAGNAQLSKLPDIKPYFALSPPRGGFKKSIRRSYGEKGFLGENPKLLETIERMV